MGLMDKLKAAAKGRSKEIDTGVDQVGTRAKAHLSDQYDSKIDTGTTKAKEAVNKLDRDG